MLSRADRISRGRRLSTEPYFSAALGFGPFVLQPAARILEREGVEVAIGSRAIDLLITLVEQAGEVVSVEDLLQAAWGGLTVAPDNVRVQIATLRRRLGQGEGHPRYIENLPARGYRFVAPVIAHDTAHKGRVSPGRRLGRDAEIEPIVNLLRQGRLETFAGQTGKAMIATAVAHQMVQVFDGAVRFLDLSYIADADTLIAAVKAALIEAVAAEMERPLAIGV